MWPFRVLRTVRLQPALVAFLARDCAQVLFCACCAARYLYSRADRFVCFFPHIRLDRFAVISPGDVTVAIPDSYPANEGPSNAIDGDTSTKYLNFGKNNAGFDVTPGTGPAIVNGLQFTSANDSPERDPTTFTLEGWDGTSFVLVAEGSIPAFTSRLQTTAALGFSNEVPYGVYRLRFPTIFDTSLANSMQIAEVGFLYGNASCDASELLPNAEGPGDCTDALPSGGSCTNTAFPGNVDCTPTACYDGDLSPGLCAGDAFFNHRTSTACC